MRFIILLSFFFSILFAHHGDVIRIGVLAKRGESITHKRWDATASYLNEKINSHQFVIVPLGFDELEEHVAEAKIDFVLTNTVYYVYLEQRYGISRIATLVNKNKQGQEMTQFGGVILTKANNSAINHLTDIKGKKFGAVDPLSFGGWIMAQYELEKVGIPEDEYKVSFFKSHDAVVKSVLNGTIDVGTVRSDTIERMHNEGKISLKDVKVINKQHVADFPYASSTRLYPEWPFARLPHASRDLSNKVLSALLQMPGDIPAAQNAYIAGWTIPLDYTIVHSVLQELHLPPYDKVPPITIEQIYQEHKLGVIIIVTLFIVAIFFVTYVNNLNSSLKKQQNTIVSLNQTLEAKVADRTEKIEKLLHDEKEQREIVDAILNSQDNIVILSDGEKLVTANHAMLEATGHTSLTSFLQDHHCISELFIKEEGYLHDMVNKNWIEYVIHSPDLEHKAKLFNRHKSQVCIYLVNAKRFIIEDHNLYIITMTDISELEIAYEQMKDQAIRDELTQIYNRRKFNEVLDIEISRSHRTMMSFSIIMFDIDDFKKINDTYGHEVGDQVLIEISKTVHGAIRKSDIFSRWGGEEFMILAPSIYLDGAIKQAEKLRQMIEEHPFEGIPEVEKVTCSFGVSEFCLKEDKESLLKRVDENLYNAKHSGKNCVMAS